MTDEQTTADLGHNNPPPDLLRGEALKNDLIDKHAGIMARRDDLLAEAENVPTAIEDDALAQKVADFIRQLSACAKAADGARVAAKEPYLEGGRGVDGFFRRISEPLDAVKRRIEARLTLYLQAKARREREEREAHERETRRQADEARRAAEKAERKARDDETMAAAIAAETARKTADAEAVKASQAAAAKPAELSRTRGEYGAVASLRTRWTFSDLDRAGIDLEALRHHLPTDGLERAVNSYIRAGGRELAGVKIFETTAAAVS